MNVSLRAIASLVPFKLSEEEVIGRINSRLAAVESVTDLGDRYRGLVVAEIVSTAPHPDADKLAIYQVQTGHETVQVVAGDTTLAAGDKVAYIPPGVVVPSTADTAEPFEIQRVQLRGQASNGMMASAKEVGFNDDHTHVLRLDTDANAGTPLVELYNLDDKIVEIENKALTHRPDGFGLIGLAREVGGITGTTFSSPDWYLDRKLPEAGGLQSLSIKNDVPELCARYSAIALDGVTVAASPLWLQTALSRVGIRPINNVVDITNYLMIVSGQPLHAFDLDKLEAVAGGPLPTLGVRRARENESIELLDGKRVEPHKDAILITANDVAVALGGVMGGANTEVGEQTTRVVIESATFDLYAIRATSMQHGVFTEAVTRYARGQDPEATVPVLKEAIRLFAELTGAQPASALSDSYDAPREAKKITVTADFIGRRLGAAVTADEVIKSLGHMEIPVTKNGEELHVSPPSWRPDLSIAEDIVEEVGRLRGYDELEVHLPMRSLLPQQNDPIVDSNIRLRHIMSRGGANEVLSYNFVSDALVGKLGLDKGRLYHIRNSISPKLQYMRSSLLPSLLSFVQPNLKAGEETFTLFELNKGHSKDEVIDDLPVERSLLGLVVAARDEFARDHHQGSAFFQVKAHTEYLAAELGTNFTYEPLAGAHLDDPHFVALKPLLYAPRAAVVRLNGEAVGVIGELHQGVAKSLKLPVWTAAAELAVDKLPMDSQREYHPLSRFPSQSQDMTFAARADLTWAELWEVVSSELTAQDLNFTLLPLDIYRPDGKAEQRLSLRVTFSSPLRTLTTDETNQALEAVAARVKTQLGAIRV